MINRSSQESHSAATRKESSRSRGESSGSRTRAHTSMTDAPESSDQGKDQSKVNWKKFVTLNPPNLVRFDLVEDDVQRIKPLPGQPVPAGIPEEELIEADDAKVEAFVEIVNKSEHYILFKVKTTNI